MRLLLLLLLTCAWPTRSSWQQTIDSAGFQRTIVEQLTAELLLIASGIDPEGNKRRISDNMNIFDRTLHDLMDGSASGHIMASPSVLIDNQLQVVDRLWHEYEHLLLDHVDTISAENSSYLHDTLEAVSKLSSELLAVCGVVVGALGDVAILLGATTNGMQQDIAGRQRSFVQMMLKETLYVSLGFEVATHLEKLMDTKVLFEASHEGIIAGDPYVGIPVLSSLCALQQMREVTYNYGKFRPVVMEILSTQSAEQSQVVATQVIREMVNLSEPLFDSMVQAVQLFVQPSTDCDPRPDMTESDWRRYLENLGQLRLLIQEVAHYFAQVAADINADAGKVELTVLMSSTKEILRKLIEGSKEDGISAPPTQEIVLDLQHAWEDWSYLETELTQVISSNVISPDRVDRNSQSSAEILAMMELVYHLCANMTTLDPPNLPLLLDLTSLQATRIANVAKEAYFIAYGDVLRPRGVWLNTTRAEFMETHWLLLDGAPATASTAELHQVTDLCALQRMKVVADLFHRLEQAALGVAGGQPAMSAELLEVYPLAAQAMNDAARFFMSGAVECVNASIDVDSLMQLHTQAVALATLSQAASSRVLLLAQNGSTEETLDAEIAEVRELLRRLTYGSPNPQVPAPFSQQALDIILLRTSPAAHRFADLLASPANVTMVMEAGAALLAESDEIRVLILQKMAELEPTYPSRRVDAASQQIALATTVYKESLLLHFGYSSTPTDLETAIAAWESRHATLTAVRENAGGEGIVRDRQDLLAQLGRAGDAWVAFKALTASPTAEDLMPMSSALDTLREELSKALPLLAVKDVEPAPIFPWPTVIYSCLGGGAVFGLCGACAFMSCRAQSKKEQQSKGGHGGLNDAV